MKVVGFVLTLVLSLIAPDALGQARAREARRIAQATQVCDSDAPPRCLAALQRLPARLRQTSALRVRGFHAQFFSLDVPLEPRGARALRPLQRTALDDVYRQLVTFTDAPPSDLASDSHASLWLLRGRCELVLDRLEDAIRSLTRATTLNSSPESLNDLAMTYVAAGRLAEAEHTLLRATQSAPNEATPWSNLGTVRLALGRANDAADAFREATSRAPNVSQHHSNLGAALLSAGQAELAVRAFGEAIRYAPADPLPRANLGYALITAGHLDDAERELIQATTIGPRCGAAWNNLSIVHARRGRRADAIRALEHALEIDPGDQRARANLEGLRASPSPSP
ncbi:MAG: tetratricopeptide repeat protein [Deltaproteobacteria bacterium]|nr:tetratricopeptide repeat protein [Deltaproteobacteria bacterium]